MANEWVPARLIHKQVWSPGLATIRLEAEVDDFEPGQFAQLTVEPSERPLKRAYSYASAPGQPPEFFVIGVDGGALSPTLVALERGDPVFITREAKGLFTLADVPTDRVPWLIATGTGLAPYISMLRCERVRAAYPGFVVVHGARSAEDLAYGDELRAFERESGGSIRYIALTSRHDLGEIPKGRLTDALADGRLEALAGRELDTSAHVLLCGNPAMIADMQTLLAERGLKRHSKREPGHVTTERYW